MWKEWDCPLFLKLSIVNTSLWGLYNNHSIIRHVGQAGAANGTVTAHQHRSVQAVLELWDSTSTISIHTTPGSAAGRHQHVHKTLPSIHMSLQLADPGSKHSSLIFCFHAEKVIGVHYLGQFCTREDRPFLLSPLWLCALGGDGSGTSSWCGTCLSRNLSVL